MKGYPKLNIDRVIAANPDQNIADMMAAAVLDHTLTNGCEFVEGAAAVAIEELGLCPADPAAGLSEEVRVGLGRALEALEINCRDKGKST